MKGSKINPQILNLNPKVLGVDVNILFISTLLFTFGRVFFTLPFIIGGGILSYFLYKRVPLLVCKMSRPFIIKLELK